MRRINIIQMKMFFANTHNVMELKVNKWLNDMISKDKSFFIINQKTTVTNPGNIIISFLYKVSE